MVAGERYLRPWESYRADSRPVNEGKLKSTTQLSGAKTRSAQMSRAAGARRRPSSESCLGTESSSYGG